MPSRSTPVGPVSVEQLMKQIENEVTSARRARLVAQGGAPEYRDPEIFARVEDILRRPIESPEHRVLLLRELLSDPDEWVLQTRLRFSSHRPIVGPWIVFIKRRLLLPLTRWLYEYSLENFRRQERINRLLFDYVEQLAIENARLTREVEHLTGRSGPPGNK